MMATPRRRLGLTAVLAGAVTVTACQSGVPTAPAVVQRPPETGTRGARDPSGPALVPGTSITAGTAVEGIIDGRDPECFPNWDATGHCRQYDVTAPSDGLMLATLQWSEPRRGLFDPDVFLVAPDGVWVYAPDGSGAKQAGLSVKAGLVYHVVVLSYGTEPQAFKLTVGLQE
jgi:hypothetical protein